MLKIREKWHNFALKFENNSESGRNRLRSRDRLGIGRSVSWIRDSLAHSGGSDTRSVEPKSHT